jgi:large subunit ribosomal protein L23
MIELRAYDVLRRPVLTEKSNYLGDQGKYVFVVDKDSNKLQIKKAVEKVFDVVVKSVNIINVPGKTKVFKGKKGKRSGYKKAVVTTKDMQKIEFSKGI